MKRLQAYGAGLGLAGILLLAGCGGDGGVGGGGEEPDDLEPQPGGTAIIVEGADISTPIALVATSALDGNLGADVMNMELVRGAWQDGTLVFQTAERSPMAIARRYEYAGPDSTALRFHMRSDLKWSDGEPLTAADVVFTYELLARPELGSPLQHYVEHLDSVVAETDSTAVFHFARRYPEMLTHTAVALVPKHAFEGVNPAELRSHPRLLDPANGNLVVSGPWMIGAWQKGQRVELVPNPHFQPQPLLDRLVFRIVPEATTRLVELQTGNVDMVTGVTFDQIPALRAQAPGVRFEREEGRFYDYIAYNPQAHPAFADPEVRRALGMALDVPAMIQALQMGEYARPAGGPYSPIFRDLYDPESTPPLPYDPEQARGILESRGWRDSDGDGVLDKDGRAFRFVLVTNSGNQRRADAAQVAQQQWRRIGVDAQLQQLEFNTFMQNMMQKEYEASLGGWSVGLSPDLTPLWAPDSPFNITGYSDPAVSALIARALAQPTPEAAAPLWTQAASEIAQDQPYTWLYYFDGIDALNPRLRGTHIDTYGPYQNTWEWWVRQ